METKKEKRGRKSRYEDYVGSQLAKIEDWCREGLIEKEISKRLGVSASQFQEYKRQHSELTETLKQGKTEPDYRVQNSLYKRALGYQYTETKTIKDESGKVIRTETSTKQLASDVTACIWWLKNRMPGKWKDRHDQEFDEDFVITVTLNEHKN